MTPANTVILGVLGEPPYAEFKGDINIPYCVNQSVLGGVGCLYDNIGHPYLPTKQRTSLALEYEKFDKEVFTTIHEHDKNIPIVTVLVAGRPMIITEALEQSQAVVSAWLPGTAGGHGIVNALTGQYKFRPGGSGDRRNTLAFDWPKTQVFFDW